MRIGFVKVLLIAAAVAPFTLGCDDDSSGGSSGPATSVPADKTLASLSDAEVTQLNEDIGRYMEQQVQASIDRDTACEFVGVTGAIAVVFFGSTDGSGTPPTDASLQEACNAAAAQCKQSNEPVQQEEGQDTEITKSQLSDCNATVAEYQKCMQDSATASVNMMKAMPKCADLKAADLQTLFTSSMAVESPQSCETVATKCPGYAGDAG